MKEFLIALQFLTRIKLVQQETWDSKEFGGSVPYFTAVGLIIGILSALVYVFLAPYFGVMTTSLLVVVFHFLLTGGLHADGFMDTCDGLFSGRDRERKLEIMKDSRVGSNGVVGFVFLVLLKWQILAVINPIEAPLVLVFLSTISKAGLTRSVCSYPYARPEGMGKAFAQYAPENSNRIAWMTLSVLMLPFLYMGLKIDSLFIVLVPLIMIGIGMGTNVVLNRYIVKHLGGVTGDTYGFVSECTELVFLFASVFMVTVVKGYIGFYIFRGLF